MLKIYLFVLLLVTPIFAGQKDAEETLIKYQKEINNAATEVNISPRLLASVIYAEHKLNYNLEDEVLDGVLANIGYNSSVGVAQVKVSTAAWIEKQLHNKKSAFYLYLGCDSLLSVSKDRSELITRLTEAKTNILYAACYIAMIEKLWNNILNIYPLEDIKP
jgi:ABC-type Fe3+-citrate transport system substrate-binding protein